MEKVSSATNTAEHSVLMDVPVLAGESALGAAMPGHLVLLRRQERLPFRVRLQNFFYAQPTLLAEQKPSLMGWDALPKGVPRGAPTKRQACSNYFFSER